MTINYRITFTDGRQATMLDPNEKPLPEIQASIHGRFGSHRIVSIERDPTTHEEHQDDLQEIHQHL